MRRALTPLTALLLAALAPHSLGAPDFGAVQVQASVPEDRLAPLAAEFEARVPAGARVAWDFGDGVSAQGARAAHTFYAPGQYRVRAQVTTALGTSSSVLQVEVRDAGPEQARAVLLTDGARVWLSAAASRVYAPPRPTWALDGRPTASPVAPTPGWHTVHLGLAGRSGPLTRDFRVFLGPVQTSVPFELEVLRLTNAARARGWNCALKAYGGPALPPLARNAELELAARTQATLMALNGYAAHVSPVDGSAPQDRVTATGYTFASTGENIAGGQQSPQEVVDAWLRSPGHCHNIMGDYREIGVAYAARAGSPNGRYWAQTFGTPR